MKTGVLILVHPLAVNNRFLGSTNVQSNVNILETSGQSNDSSLIVWILVICNSSSNGGVVGPLENGDRIVSEYIVGSMVWGADQANLRCSPDDGDQDGSVVVNAQRLWFVDEEVEDPFRLSYIASQL